MLSVLIFTLLLSGAAASCPSSCYSLTSSSLSSRDADAAFLACCTCAEPSTSLMLAPLADALCGAAAPTDAPSVGALVAARVYALMELQGMWFLDGGGPEDNATACLAHLFAFMPRRDTAALFQNLPGESIDFLHETVRSALAAWPRLQALGVPFAVFLDGVLPYAILNEKRDWSWRWRPRLARLFATAWDGAASIGDAMHNLSALIPSAAADFPNFIVANFSDMAGALQQGQVFRWHSETSPGFLSVQQVASRYGSCTGTGIVMVAAARAIGIPARLAGCSQTDVPNDDHHWAEYFDPASPGPFGTFWHTKEGTSKGNEGGPWDSPSGPMMGCLRGVTPNSSLNTMWASAWGGSAFLPTLWQPQTAPAWAFLGGENVCGAYCSAWGCGPNNTERWTQAQCGPQ